jgi:hypothetical protein
MKHLRKYNESESQLDDLLSWVRICFSDFYDKDEYEVEEGLDFDDRFAIMINMPNIESPYLKKDIKVFTDWSTELNDFFLDIQVAINRVKDRYPGVGVALEEDSFQKKLDDSKVKTIKYIRIYFKK